MATIWITGARGFIGRHLARQLAISGDTVLGIGHGQWPVSNAQDWGVRTWVNGAIEPANLARMMASGGLPSKVYHLAGGSSVGESIRAPLEDYNRTVGSAAQLFDWLRKEAPQASVTVVSSAAVHGAGHVGLISAEAYKQPFSPYGHHKLMLEQLTRSYADCFGLRAVIVRLFSVYGPWLHKQLLWDLSSRLASGVETLQLGGDGGELRDWTHVTDVARLLQDASNVASAKVVAINAGSGKATPVRNIVNMLVDAWGRPVPFEFSGIVRAGDPYSLVSEPCTIGGEQFSWHLPVAEGILQYVDWFKKACT